MVLPHHLPSECWRRWPPRHRHSRFLLQILARASEVEVPPPLQPSRSFHLSAGAVDADGDGCGHTATNRPGLFFTQFRPAFSLLTFNCVLTTRISHCLFLVRFVALASQCHGSVDFTAHQSY